MCSGLFVSVFSGGDRSEFRLKLYLIEHGEASGVGADHRSKFAEGGEELGTFGAIKAAVVEMPEVCARLVEESPARSAYASQGATAGDRSGSALIAVVHFSRIC